MLRLLNLNKKRREADVLRGQYVFAPHAEIDRFLWHAHESFDDAQLTALSNPLRAEQLGGRQRRRQRRRARSRSTAAGDLPTQGRARAGSVSSRLSTIFRRTAYKPATPMPPSPLPRVARRLFRVTPPSSTTSRGPQPSRLDARASAV
jgi:hypothetical protein